MKNTQNNAQHLHSLKNHQHCFLDFPCDQQLIFHAMESFFRFLELEPELKNFISFSVNPRHRRADIGYASSSKEKEYGDDKEYFHYHPEIHHRYSDFIHSNFVVKDFMSKANQIWEVATKTVSSFLLDHQLVFNDLEKKIFDHPTPHIQLRFLKYSWQNPQEQLASGHYDAGTLTLAIAESAPGLRIGKNQEELKLIEHTVGKSVFLMGRDFTRAINNNEFQPSWHDVIQVNDQISNTSQETTNYSRWALVCFFTDYHGSVSPSKEDTHKTLIH